MKTKGTVWVLGASSGLGLATANAFARDGWLVVAGARSFETPSADASQMHRFPLDVTDAESCRRFIGNALEVSPRVDALCYAAGLLILGSCEETSPEEYQHVIQTNFLGMVRMVNEALPIMREQGGGKIVLFSSLNGLVPTPFQSAYTASKHAIEGYAQCLAMETKPFGIRICVVQPGDHQGGSLAYRLNAEQAGVHSVYSKEYQSACKTIHRDESAGLHPGALGEKVARNTGRRKMRYHLRVARPDQRAAVWIHGLLWRSLTFSLLRAYYVRKG